MGGRGWELQCIRPPVMRVFVDAAIHVEGSAYTVGVWGPRGPAIRHCPVWITNQQSAELWGVLAGLEYVRSAHLKTYAHRV